MASLQVDTDRILATMRDFDAKMNAANEAYTLANLAFKENHPLPKPTGNRSDGPRCKSCGGESLRAPNQYKGNHHRPGCKEKEMSEDSTKIHHLFMDRRDIMGSIADYKRVCFEGTEINAQFLAKGFRLELSEVNGEGELMVAVFRNGGTVIVVYGTLENAIGWLNNDGSVTAAWKLGY